MACCSPLRPGKRPRVSLSWSIPDPAPLRARTSRHFRDSGKHQTAEAAVPAPSPELRPWFRQTESIKAAWISGGISARSFSLSLGSSTVRIPTRCAASNFFLHAADGQNLAAQRDFAGHGHVAAHRNVRQGADDGRADGDSGRRAVLGDGALGHVHVNIDVAVEVVRQAEGWRCASAHSSWPPARIPA